MTAVRVHLCGPLRVTIDDEDRTDRLRGRQGRLLFAFLVWHRDRLARRDELVDAIWSGEGQPPSDRALAPVLSRLRGALSPAVIDGRDALRLVLPDDAWVDVEAARGDPAVAAGLEELLPGLDAPWLSGPRDEVLDLRVHALERAGDIASARAAVALAPFRESARVALIRALRASGNVAEAVRAYEDIRVLLRDELGTTPGPELLSLHGELLDAPAPAPAAAPAARAPSDLVERDRELHAVDIALSRLAAGTGGGLLFEGPAGVGKTRMLGELRTRALAAGARVLEARASVLEHEYGFGVVRQLLEEVAAEPGALDAGAAPARGALVDGASIEGTFAVLNGLFHIVTRVAAETPVVVCVDDLQWSDATSLRFVAYAVRRIADHRILFAASIRTGEPDADEALLSEIAQEPGTVTLRPTPLTAAATAALVRDALGADTDDRFAASCHEVTGGNPLLVRQLISALAAEGVTPDAAHADVVRAIGPRAVSRTVLLRLARLPDPAVAVARAVAVLGERPGLALIAAFAGAEEPEAADALDALARADILRAGDPTGFVHPLVRDAVYGEMAGARRGLEHLRAAHLLADRGASPERVAAQLLLSPPREDPWVVERLREAARQALDRGAPDSALAHLQRAQAEPPPPDLQPALALELGEVALLVNGAAAIAPLQEAHAKLTDPWGRGRAALELSRLMFFINRADEGAQLAGRAIAELPDGHDDLRDGLRAVRAVSVFFGATDPSELLSLDALRTQERGKGPGARSLTSMLALTLALQCGPADEAAALAREALEDDIIFEWDPGVFVVGAGQAIGLRDPEEGVAAFEHMRQVANRRGSVLDVIGADLWGGLVWQYAGDLVAAANAADRAWEGERFWGAASNEVMGYSSAFLAMAWLERGDLDRAAAALDRIEVRVTASDGGRFWLAAHARLLLERGRAEEVLPVAALLAENRPPDFHPIWSPWRELRARALFALGDAEEAVRLAGEELALARRTGAAWVTGRGLRILAELEDGDRRLEHLREARALLEPSSARLELAKVHALIAADTGDAGSRQAALALARECGADRLAASLA